ncbi:MAG: choice-of-anchor tandem repeat GloVer-containing protein [Terracidiphilus sp.]
MRQSNFTAMVTAIFPLNLRMVRSLAWMFPAAVFVVATAQTPPTALNSPLAVGTAGYGVVEAGDGNYYAMSLRKPDTCAGNDSMICSYIYQIVPGKPLTDYHSFQPASTANPNPTNLDGLEPTALIVGTDGNLYGACRLGGPGGFGTIFKIAPGGVFTVLTSFGVKAGTGLLDPGNLPLSLIQGADGNLYFVNVGGVYSLSPNRASGTVTTVATFPYSEANQSDPDGYNASSIMQASDGNFYLTVETTPGIIQGVPGSSVGGIVQVTPGATISVVHTFAADGSEGLDPYSPLVEGPDGYLYGATRDSSLPTGNGVAFKVQPSANGSFTSLGPLPGQGSGPPDNALFVGSDGNLYGATPLGGATTAAHCTPFGCGLFFQMTPSGTFTTVYAFQGGNAASQNPNPAAPIDGAFPNSPVMQTDSGDFVGGSNGLGNNTPAFFEIIDTAGKIDAPVKLTVTPAIAAVNTPVKVSWTVSNAFSDTAQNCGAVVKGGLSGVGAWSGRQTGTLANGVYSGSTTITPTQQGAYTLGLVCGGNEAGFADLQVSAGLTVTTLTLPQGQVNVAYKATLAAVGGTPHYTWSIANLPSGLTLDPSSGILGGSPAQFGSYSLAVTVKDSANPQAEVNATLALTIQAGLKIVTPSLVKAIINNRYNQPITAKYGLPPYTWTITAGTLPDGLTFFSNTPSALIDGTPTATGNVTITVQVADSEATPAMQTATYELKVFPDVQIAAVEFTQAIQQFQYLDDLEASLTSNGEPPVPIISSKHAVMRVYFTRVDQATNVVLMVSGAASDQKQFNIPPYCDPELQRSHESPKNCPSIDIYFDPPSGSWSEVLTLNDDSGNQIEQETLNITSRDALAINLKGVWVCTTPGQPTSCQDPASLLTLKAFAEKTLPTASVTVNPTRTHVSEDVTQHVGDTWVDAVIPKLTALFTPLDTLVDLTSLQRTDYTGVYNHVLAKTTTGIAEIGDHGVLISDSFLGVNPNVELATEMVLAHEIGHSLSLTHTGLGNPASSYPGCWAANVFGPPWGTNWIYNDNYVQDSAGYETGFDVVANTVIPAQASFELMSYCEPNWITPLNYKRALLYVNPGPLIAPSLRGGARGAITAESATRPKPAITLTPGSYWSVNGTLPSTGGVNLAPIFTETMPGSVDPGSGPYSIQELNAAGQALYTRFFTPIQGAIDPSFGNTTDAPFTDGIFSEFIPVTPGTTAIAITDPTGSPLTSIPIAGIPPKVTITSPAAGFAGTGEESISWNIQSTASGTFTSRIYYSVDNGTTWEQIDETTAMTDVLDFNTLPGTPSALVRVDVSDGVNTGSATSVPFSVPKKAPSTIVINSPATGAIQQAANPVFLTGGAYDADDGVLSGKALEWSDSVQGSLGSGSPLMVRLEPGSHTITLTATDSDGNALNATTQITLGGAPVVTLTTSQNSTCYSASINAAAGASGANLTAVNYSIDGGATYTPIALASLPFTLPLNGTGIVNVAAVAVDASGQVSAKSAQVNLGAGCISDTVKANAGSNQNTVVGSAFATALTTLVVDQNGNPASGITVTYTAPASGASATLSATTAATNASGMATVTATANNSTGAYNVTATAPNGSSTATFALANSDFQIAAAAGTLTVSRGSSGADVVTLTALSGFSGTVTFGCQGLPAGTTCTFAPATVTPTAATTSTTMTIEASQTASLRRPAGGGIIVVCTLMACIVRRRKYFSGLAIIVFVAVLFGLTACGSSSHTQPTTASITVTASAGPVQRTTTVTLQIQ